MRRPPPITALLLLPFILLASCTAAHYSQRAYENATSLKVDALTLLGKATEPFDQHRDETKELLTNIEKAYEYAKGLPGNEESTEQWRLLMDAEDGTSVNAFLKRWKREKTLGTTFVEEATREIGNHFDSIIRLESNKVRR